MALSAFATDGTPPRPEDLKKTLGKAGALWAGFVGGVEAKVPSLQQRWNYSGAKFGWSLRLMKRNRILVYMTPQDGRFLVGVVLGNKAVEAADHERLSPMARKAIDSAPRYAEGRGIRLTVASRRDLTAALQLVALKAAS